MLIAMLGVAALADALSLAEGAWGLADPGERPDWCVTEPLVVSIDRQNGRYRSERDGYVANADILTVIERSLTIRYDGPEGTNEDGEPVVWFMVFTDDDTFVWVRGDWITAHGITGSTAPRSRCPTE